MTEQPRLLVISPRFLFPLDQGGRIRTVNTLRRLKGGMFHVTLLSPAPDNLDPWGVDLALTCDRFVSWPAASLTRTAQMLALLQRRPVSVVSDKSVAGCMQVAAELALAPDLVLVDFPHAAVLLPPGRLSIPAVVWTHNVEAEIFARHAALARGPLRLVWKDQARKMRRFEQTILHQFDTVIAVSQRDAEVLRADYLLPHVQAVETGVDTEYYAFHPCEDAPNFGPKAGTIVFTGAMDSRSNIEGVSFLMDQVWPLILRDRPEARALIVGRNPSPALTEAARQRGLNWTFTGFVEDVRPFVAQAHVYVIPLRVGSGTRIKVFEAMAMGCPVVSTTQGVEGLAVRNNLHFMASDTASGFAAAILDLLDAPLRRDALSLAARALVVDQFGWAMVSRQFEGILHDAMARTRQRVSPR